MEATTGAFMKCSSIYLLKASPITAAGRQATMTLPQRSSVARRSACDLLFRNGLSFSAFSTTTARIAPS